MTLSGIVVGFNYLEESASLRGLVTDRGYSRPTKEDPLARRELVLRGVSAASVEVERKGEHAFATINMTDHAFADEAVRTVIEDFKAAGLLE